MFARIYQPSKTAMSSGNAKTTTWVLEFAPTQENRQRGPLFPGLSAVCQQVRISR